MYFPVLVLSDKFTLHTRLAKGCVRFESRVVASVKLGLAGMFTLKGPLAREPPPARRATTSVQTPRCRRGVSPDGLESFGPCVREALNIRSRKVQ